MRFSFLFSSAVLVAADLAAQQRSASQGYASSDQIRTSATATRSIPPELAVARFEFSARDSTLSGAARGAAAIGDAIRRAVG